MTEALLSVKGLRSGYGAVEVLRGIDLEIRPGEIVALLGSNGAGKTTFNQTVSALIPARAGSIRFDGRDITHAHYRDVVGLGLIHVPEGRRIFPNLSALENLELGSFARARGNRAANLQRVFDIFPRLQERTAQIAGTMSGGEQQMLAIGRGLMGEPRLLILDLVGRLHAQGLSILLVEQNVAQSLEVAQRAYVMENGAIQFSGSSADLMASDRLRQAYLGV
jgi:branched-chain amino acid transport system ATP-binding protein